MSAPTTDGLNDGSIRAFKPGERVRHGDLGEGVVIAPAVDGFIKVFFPSGERQIRVEGLGPALSRSEAIVLNAKGDGSKRALRAWLCYQAHALPLMDNVSALTSAKIDLLPHQVVLTHRVATAAPRRFLIADEVGLGKTIETALILRELISRGELKRALMVVPAGLVNNWHRELNEVFHLNFEVFGSEGDVTDRKSNAFEKHNLLIASIDTLKVRARMARLKAAPPWDLVVFDEAHHLTAYRQNGKLVKTQNFRLAELLKEHTRDLLLLSATPHQGDHFRFWMLVQTLDPTLFNSPGEMVQHRHRLNSVVFRRTKADACRPDGSTLFARRQVHTEAFSMSEVEKIFYDALVAYLQDGFALAKRQGKSGHGLAFVMTIFQKIAASSFAAVQRTLRRRLIALTIQESLMHDQKLGSYLGSDTVIFGVRHNNDYNLCHTAPLTCSRFPRKPITAGITREDIRSSIFAYIDNSREPMNGRVKAIASEDLPATDGKLDLPGVPSGFSVRSGDQPGSVGPHISRRITAVRPPFQPVPR